MTQFSAGRLASVHLRQSIFPSSGFNSVATDKGKMQSLPLTEYAWLILLNSLQSFPPPDTTLSMPNSVQPLQKQHKPHAPPTDLPALSKMLVREHGKLNEPPTDTFMRYRTYAWAYSLRSGRSPDSSACTKCLKLPQLPSTVGLSLIKVGNLPSCPSLQS